MPIKATSITEYFKRDKNFCALIYGLPGSGKTQFVGSGQQNAGLADMVFVDADPDGLLTIANVEGIHKVSYEILKDLIELPSYLRKNIPTAKTVVFDTLTAVKARRLAEIAKNRGDIDKQQIQDWGVAGNNIERIVFDLRSSGYSVIFTAGVKDETNKETGRFEKRRPDLPPALNTRMEHIASFIWHLYKAPDNSYNLMYVDSTGGRPVDVKTRNLEFVNALKALDKTPGVIQIGQTGQDTKNYPNLSTMYNLLVLSLDKKASV